MSDKTIYLKMDTKIKVATDVVRIGDLGKIYCKEEHVVNKIKTREFGMANREFFSFLYNLKLFILIKFFVMPMNMFM